MKISVNTEIALTYLSSRKKQTAVAALGVMFGISMFIFMQSLMKGTNDYFEKASFSSISHIRLFNENKVADNHMLREAIKDSSVKILVNPKQLRQSQPAHTQRADAQEVTTRSAVAQLPGGGTENVQHGSKADGPILDSVQARMRRVSGHDVFAGFLSCLSDDTQRILAH
ncbi:MAG: hypothetical protein EBU46_16685 [Nitrosomonadaceae bacterium]|nr:hypothetical protein [Nitrosomonadaceae bacterium]